jgi:hypothetical protein
VDPTAGPGVGPAPAPAPNRPPRVPEPPAAGAPAPPKGFVEGAKGLGCAGPVPAESAPKDGPEPAENVKGAPAPPAAPKEWPEAGAGGVLLAGALKPPNVAPTAGPDGGPKPVVGPTVDAGNAGREGGAEPKGFGTLEAPRPANNPDAGAVAASGAGAGETVPNSGGVGAAGWSTVVAGFAPNVKLWGGPEPAPKVKGCAAPPKVDVPAAAPKAGAAEDGGNDAEGPPRAPVVGPDRGAKPVIGAGADVGTWLKVRPAPVWKAVALLESLAGGDIDIMLSINPEPCTTGHFRFGPGWGMVPRIVTRHGHVKVLTGSCQLRRSPLSETHQCHLIKLRKSSPATAVNFQVQANWRTKLPNPPLPQQKK